MNTQALKVSNLYSVHVQDTMCRTKQNSGTQTYVHIQYVVPAGESLWRS